MTSDELKKLLEARAIIDTPNICNSCYAEGFRNAFDIMWPLVEALEFYSQGGYNFRDGSLARKRLTDLEQKLKGSV